MGSTSQGSFIGVSWTSVPSDDTDRRVSRALTVLPWTGWPVWRAMSDAVPFSVSCPLGPGTAVSDGTENHSRATIDSRLTKLGTRPSRPASALPAAGSPACHRRQCQRAESSRAPRAAEHRCATPNTPVVSCRLLPAGRGGRDCQTPALWLLTPYGPGPARRVAARRTGRAGRRPGPPGRPRSRAPSPRFILSPSWPAWLGIARRAMSSAEATKLAALRPNAGRCR